MKNKVKTILLDILCDIIGSILYAGGIHCFAQMANFATGGVSGLALIMKHLWNLPVGVMTIVMNIPLVIISWKIVGKKYVFKTMKTMVFTMIFLDVIFPFIPMYTGNRLTAALYSGLCMGSGMAFFYMRGSSSGGSDFISMIVKVRHPFISLGIVTAITDFLVIMLGWPVFKDVESVLYGIVNSFAASIVIDRILYGVGAGKMVLIITTRTEELIDKISEMTDRGATIIKAIGSYTKEDKDIILCACSKSQTYTITSLAHEVDAGAFVMVTETSEVFGEGFKDYKKEYKQVSKKEGE